MDLTGPAMSSLAVKAGEIGGRVPHVSAETRLERVIPDMIVAVLLTCADLPQQASEQRI